MKIQTLSKTVDLLKAATPRTTKITSRPPDQVEIEPQHGPGTVLQAESWPSPGPPSSTRLLVMHRHSRRELDLLRAAEASFVSFAGAVRLDIPGLFIDRTDLAPAQVESPPAGRNPFSDRASLIVRVLFAEGADRVWMSSELACHAGVADSTCSYVIRELSRMRLVRVERDGRESRVSLIDEVALLEAWTRSYDWRRNTSISVNAPVGSTSRFLRRLSRSEMPRWAVTLHAGSDVLRKFAPVEKVHLYVDVQNREGLGRFAGEQGWDHTLDGSLVLMAPYYRQSLWPTVRTVDGIQIVSALQLILDLWEHPLRGRETAEVLLQGLVTKKKVRD